MNNLESYFQELTQKGINLTEGQKQWYSKKYSVLGESMKKEFPSTPDEAFEVNTNGLYYATHISIARAQKRICNIPYDPTIRVHTAWDLGFSDATSIIFFQLSGREIHIIDFIEDTGKEMPLYIKMLKSKDYIYGTHLAPHDIRNHEYSTGLTRFETASKLGFSFTLTADLSLNDGIDVVRNIFNRLFFHNSDPVLNLVRHIENYSQKWDQSLGIWSGRPCHDSHSHAADALRYLAIGLDNCHDEAQTISQNEATNLWKTHGKKI